MRNLFLYLTIVLLTTIAVLSTSCKNNPPPPTYPTYNYTDPIINPPDVFQIIYNITTHGDKQAYVTFKEDAVWLIEKLGDSRISFVVSNDTTSIEISVSDTLGLKAGHTYTFVANNNYTEYTNFFTLFTKLAIDYETFEPKF